jgi:hypothetical protein
MLEKYMNFTNLESSAINIGIVPPIHSPSWGRDIARLYPSLAGYLSFFGWWNKNKRVLKILGYHAAAVRKILLPGNMIKYCISFMYMYMYIYIYMYILSYIYMYIYKLRMYIHNDVYKLRPLSICLPTSSHNHCVYIYIQSGYLT